MFWAYLEAACSRSIAPELTLSFAFACLCARETKMTYDWDGQRTRRLVAFKLLTAVAAGLSLPLALTVWTYIG